MCEQVSQLGYEGLELAPHTLAEDATTLTSEQRLEIANRIQDAGLRFVGLHWLLVSPPGLHITTPDEAQRKKSWDYVHRAIDLCADLTDQNSTEKGVIVIGSPKQRSTEGKMSPRQAADLLTHELAHAAPHAETRGVKLLLEALSPRDSDVVNCLGDAVAIVRQIGSPAVQSMFDVHNAIEEKDRHTELIRRNHGHIHHVHVNELDGQEPGRGDYDFARLLGALRDLDYKGWVSVEAFDFSRDPREIAERAITHLKASEATLAEVQ
ncbi:MAG: Xylose isomerase domain protein barrel [Bryobacterales bacterium]|nr:Xylose isomerase domain protein barrel [Bryobacterales bacterium]